MEIRLKHGSFAFICNSKEGLPSAILVCAMVIVTYIWIRRKKNGAQTLVRPLPGLKVRPYDPYGNLNYLPTANGLKEMGVDLGSAALDIVIGTGVIFQREGIFTFRLAYHQYVVLTKPEYAEKLLSSTVFLEKGDLYDLLHPWLGTGLLTSHGAKWKTRRKLLTHSFHFDILKDFVPVFDGRSRVLVEILKARGHEKWLDIIPLITLCSLDIICETTLGVHVDAQKGSGSEYVQAVTNASEILLERVAYPPLHINALFWSSSIGRKFKRELERLHGFTRKVIQEKKNAIKSNRNKIPHSDTEESEFDQRKKKRKALMDLLLDVHLNNPEFSEEDIREEIDTFAFEGHDTTSMGMCWALYLIGLYPDVQSKIYNELYIIYGDDRERPATMEDLKEMSYLERVLKESQRLYPSVPFYTRKANEDFHLPTYTIKKGSELVISTMILHRNPEAFPNPEKFDPDRFLPEKCDQRHPFAYLPFSAGPRNCIGQRFAMLEEKTVISNILRNFNLISLDHRDKISFIPELTLRSVRPLKLKFTLRQ